MLISREGKPLRKRHLLITGLPGTGKTTLLIRLARRFAEHHTAGFYAEEIRKGGVRQGFRLLGLDGKKGILAHISFHGSNRAGRYGVDIEGFERFLGGIALEESSAALIFIDEIGKMECLSPFYVALVRRLLDSGKTVVATISSKGGGFIAEVKGRADCEIREVTVANREMMVEELAAWIIEHEGQIKCAPR
jgi:nucleoside-triphosphatase